jgi:hypothetical protein
VPKEFKQTLKEKTMLVKFWNKSNLQTFLKSIALISLFIPFITGCDSSSPPPLKKTLIVIDNKLARPVNVFLNGKGIGSVDPAKSDQVEATGLNSIEISYQVVNAVLEDKTPVGDPMGGIFQKIVDPKAQEMFEIDNLIGTQYYFYPKMLNKTQNNYLLSINYKLASENRCCAIKSGANSEGGYFKLSKDSNIYAFDPLDGFVVNEKTLSFTGFGGQINRGSGVASFSLNPSAPLLTQNNSKIDTFSEFVNFSPFAEKHTITTPMPNIFYETVKLPRMK